MDNETTSIVETELAPYIEQVEAKEGESAGKHRARVARKAQNMSEEDWAELSEETQLWMNDALERIENRKAPQPYDAVIEAEEDASDAEEDDDATETTAPPADENVGPITSGPAKDSEGRFKRGGGLMLKRMAVNDLKAQAANGQTGYSITPEEFMAQIHEAGYAITMNSVNSGLYETQQVLKALAEEDIFTF